MLWNRLGGGDGVMVVHQAEHAGHAGAMAAALAPGTAPEPREPLVTATSVHDDGWRAYDASPGLDPDTGLPHTYRSIPLEPYLGIWRRGIAGALEHGAHVGLLVSLHGTAFLEGKPDPRARAFVEAKRREQARALEQLGLERGGEGVPEPVGTQFAWLRFLDGLSLFCLDRWGSPWRGTVGERGFTATRDDQGVVHVDPWPFRGSRHRFDVDGLRLDPGPYPTEEALHEALGSAEPASRTVVLSGPG